MNTSQQQSQHQQQQDGVSLFSDSVEIEAWAVPAEVESPSISIIAVGAGTDTSLTIPLYENDSTKPSNALRLRVDRGKEHPLPLTLLQVAQRDSLTRREAIRKGSEGSRQRRRWENDRLVHVPNVQPPEPRDFLVLPTHPVRNVPYQATAVWDLRVRAEVEAKKTAAARKKQKNAQTLGDEKITGRVPRELFGRAKKTPAIRTWVRSLEEPVRQFLVEREAAREPESEDTEDEEIVFVGRNGSMRDGWKRAKRESQGQKQENGMVFDSLGDDESSAFKRWITHSISQYYGLVSRSVIVDNRKVVYVGVKEMKTGHAPMLTELPRPLWELC